MASWADHYKNIGIEPQVRGVVRDWLQKNNLADVVTPDGPREKLLLEALYKVFWRSLFMIRMEEIHAGVETVRMVLGTIPPLQGQAPSPQPEQAGEEPGDAGEEARPAVSREVGPTRNPRPRDRSVRPPPAVDDLEPEVGSPGAVDADAVGADEADKESG